MFKPFVTGRENHFQISKSRMTQTYLFLDVRWGIFGRHSTYCPMLYLEVDSVVACARWDRRGPPDNEDSSGHQQLGDESVCRFAENTHDHRKGRASSVRNSVKLSAETF